MTKSSVVKSGGQLHAFAVNLKKSLVNPRDQLLLGVAAGLGIYAVMAKDSRRRQLAAVTTGAIFLHLLAGRYGWYNRNELYDRNRQPESGGRQVSIANRTVTFYALNQAAYQEIVAKLQEFRGNPA